jgi:hypothetical protein
LLLLAGDLGQWKDPKGFAIAGLMGIAAGRGGDVEQLMEAHLLEGRQGLLISTELDGCPPTMKLTGALPQ